MAIIFEKEYEQYENLDESIFAAESEDEREAIREQFLELEKSIKGKGETYYEYFRMYARMKTRHNDHIDFSRVIWEDDVQDMVKALKAFGFRSFTVSFGYSELPERFWELIQSGCVLVGMIEINGDPLYYDDDKLEKIHAFLFALK